MPQLAKRLDTIDEPQTIAMAKLSRELAAKGHDVISLSLGEPDFDTPAHIVEAAKKALDDHFTFYTPVAGIPELRQAICDKFQRENQLSFNPNQVVVSTGAKQAIINAVMAIVNKGDEVIIPTPYWVSYSGMVRLMEGIPVFIKSTVEQDYKINAQSLEAAITPKTTAFMFSSPCNPTGSVYSKKEMEELASVFLKHPEIFIISDEIYEHINYTGAHFSIAQIPELKDRVVVVNGFSKSYAMTGWRVGYIGASVEIAVACEKLQGQFTSGSNSIAQRAAVVALNSEQSSTQKMKEAYRRRKDLVFEALRGMEGIKCNHPEGAFYAFPDVSYFFGKSGSGKVIQNATDLCMYILHDVFVSMVTGDAFGAPECIRISFATSDEKIKEALKRVKESLSRLK